MAVDIVLSIGLYKPLGIAGLVIGTAVANIVMTWLQIRRLRTGFNGRLDLDQTVMITVRIAGRLGDHRAIAWGVHRLADAVLGHGSVVGQLIAVGLAVVIAGAFYARAVTAMRIPEARQIQDLVLARLGRAQAR